MKNVFSQKFFLVLFFCVIGFVFQNCKGGACAFDSPAEDLDSDCVADTGDNCPFTYNPLQRDTNDNLIGDACEADEAVVSASLTKEFSELFLKKKVLENCSDYKVVGCHGKSLNLTNLNGASADSLANPYSVFGSEAGICSAFNVDAPRPPKVFCITQDDQSYFLGHLTINPNLSPHLDPCDFLEEFNGPLERCEGI